MKFVDTPTLEQETTISYCRNEKSVKIWTNDRTQITRLDRLCANSPYYTKTEQKNKDGDILAVEYRIAEKRLLSFRSGNKSVKES